MYCIVKRDIKRSRPVWGITYYLFSHLLGHSVSLLSKHEWFVAACCAVWGFKHKWAADKISDFFGTDNILVVWSCSNLDCCGRRTKRIINIELPLPFALSILFSFYVAVVSISIPNHDPKRELTKVELTAVEVDPAAGSADRERGTARRPRRYITPGDIRKSSERFRTQPITTAERLESDRWEV